MHNLTALRPILCNKMQCLLRLDILMQHINLRDYLIEAYNNPTTNFRMSRSSNFISKVHEFQKQAKHIKMWSKMTQARFSMVSDCWGNFNLLILGVKTHRNDRYHDLLECKLSTACIREDLIKLLNLCFQKGIIKMQNNDAQSMVSAEHVICSSLRITS